MGQWIRSFGQLDPTVAFGEGMPHPPRTLPQAPEIAALTVELRQSTGDKDRKEPLKRMTAIRHAAELSETPVKKVEAPLVLDDHLPRWL